MDPLSMSELSTANSHLSSEETREIVTPYAFKVSDDLLDTPLATPTKRGLALSIDLALVAMLTQVSSVLLAGIAAWTFFKAGNRLQQKKRFNGFRIFLRFLTAFLLFVVGVGIFDEINQKLNTDEDNPKIISAKDDVSASEGINMVAVTAKYFMLTREMTNKVAEGKCPQALVCWQTLGEDLAEDVADTPLNENEAKGTFEGFVEQTDDTLTETEQQQLLLAMVDRYKQSLAAKEREEEPLGETSELSDINADLQESVKDMSSVVTKLHEENKKQEESFSLIAWVKGIAADMGLGFGWAAFYFSLFTAWWHGQTPGKRLFKIKVIQLDGSGLNLWQSFERYGGYGAGLATGLLGFLQIYWDPNRQAIHDKISATLVIDIAKPKVPFVKGSA